MLGIGKILDGNSMSKSFKVKRRIEKVRNMVDMAVTTATTSLILHTAEDAKTLVRTIIDLIAVDNAANVGTAQWHLVLAVESAGVQVVVPSATQALDVPATNMLIWENAGVLRIQDAMGSGSVVRINADTKGMRKLKELDEIVLLHRGDVATSIRIVGTITLFFKE